MTEDSSESRTSDDEDVMIPPVEGLRDAFSGYHYSNAVSDLVRSEYEAAYKLWQELPKTKFKVRGVILTMCLNIDIDPEEWRDEVWRDVPVARKECGYDFWVNGEAFEEVNNSRSDNQAQRQYDRILEQLKAQYIENIGSDLILGPKNSCIWNQFANGGPNGATKDNVRKAADRMRWNREDPRTAHLRQRVQIDPRQKPLTLFHYNGHDVPRPTENGEIWLFSPEMDQYHPMSLTELGQVLGPSIYVWDCCQAGLIVEKFFECNDASALPAFHFAACGRNEYRPIRADISADIFTSCLTNPVRTALKWALERESCRLICPRITPAMMDRIPGEKKARKTLLGELMWVLTGLMDSIFLDCVVKSCDERHDIK